MLIQKMSLNKGWFKILTEEKWKLKGCGTVTMQASNRQSHPKHCVLGCAGLGFIRKSKWVRTVILWDAQHNRFSLADILHLVNSRCHSPALAFSQYPPHRDPIVRILLLWLPRF